METPTSEKLTTRAVGIRYGLILAAISVIYFLGTTMLGFSTSEGPGQWVSLIFVAVVFFLAHKYFKENGDGFMTYGQGMGIGFWASLVSSSISSVFTYMYVKFIDTSFIENIREKQIEKMQESGISDEQIETSISMMEKFTTPEMILVFGIVGGIFFSVLVALVITIFTQKKNQEATF
jgi:hypothetical protein